MKSFLLILLIMFAVESTISQEIQMVRHQVKLGETVRMLAIKYHVPPADIYRLNKFAVEGIREGMVLLIPAEKKYAEMAAEDGGVLPDPPQTATPESAEVRTIRHKVEPGETLSGLSAKYNIPAKVIADDNPFLSNGLQAGQTLTIRLSD